MVGNEGRIHLQLLNQTKFFTGRATLAAAVSVLCRFIFSLRFTLKQEQQNE